MLDKNDLQAIQEMMQASLQSNYKLSMKDLTQCKMTLQLLNQM